MRDSEKRLRRYGDNRGSSGSMMILFIVISLVGGLLIGALIGRSDIFSRLWRQATDEVSALAEGLGLKPSYKGLQADETFFLLCDTVADKNEAPDLFALVHFNSRLKRFSVVIVPPETVVDVSGRNREELSKMFGYGKRPLIMSALNGLLGTSIDSYVVLRPQDFGIIDDIGGLPVSVSQFVKGGPRLGQVKANGDQVRAYAGAQFGDPQDAQIRTERQREILDALKSRLQSTPPKSIEQSIDKRYPGMSSSLNAEALKRTLYSLGDKATRLSVETVPARFESAPEYSYFDPKPDEIKNLVSVIMTGKASAKPEAGEVSPTAVKRVIRLQVLNGTDKKGLAREVAGNLQKQGYKVVDVQTADRSDYTRTRITALTTNGEAEAARLKAILGVGFIRRKTLEQPEFDVKIIVGRDYMEL